VASWIVHLRIAENLLELIPGLDAEQFVVGSIAPDSGIPDEKWEKFTPPTEVTHVQAPEGALHHSADLEFYRRYLADLPWPGSDPRRYSFLLGFFFHLLADNLWSVRIGHPTHERYKAQFDENRDFIWEVKKDWYGLDFEYVRDYPASIFWKVFLKSEYSVHYLDFLLEEGVRRQLEYIKTYYQRTDERIQAILNRERIYLTREEMDAFVDEATQLFYQIYHQLRTENPSTEGHWSGLELASFGGSF
jgi:hypothetical protein